MNDDFIKAIIQASTNRANLGASPAATATPTLQPQIDNLNNLAQLKFIANAANIAGKAGAGNAGNNADINEANRQATEQTQQANLQEQQKLQDRQAAIQDPKNYQRVLNSAGGYTYLDGSGNPITVNQYASATNTTIADALKGSTDPADEDFVNDYNDTMQLGQIMATGDKTALDKFYTSRPGLQSFIKDNGIKTWSQYVSAFQQAYPDRFSNQQAQNTAGRPVSNIGIGG